MEKENAIVKIDFEKMKHLDIDINSYCVLTLIIFNVTDIAHITGLTRQAIHKIINKLISKNYLQQTNKKYVYTNNVLELIEDFENGKSRTT